MKANLTTLDSREHEYCHLGKKAVRARDANDEPRTFDSVGSIVKAVPAWAAAADPSHAQDYVTPDDFKDWSVPRT